ARQPIESKHFVRIRAHHIKVAVRSEHRKSRVGKLWVGREYTRERAVRSPLQHLVAQRARYIHAAVRTERNSHWPVQSIARSRHINKSAGSTVVSNNFRVRSTCHVKISAWTEGDSPRPAKAAPAGKRIDERARQPVETQNAVRVDVGHIKIAVGSVSDADWMADIGACEGGLERARDSIVS